MNQLSGPITASTALSIGLHGVGFALLLSLYELTAVPERAAGNGLDIELISSTIIAQQLQSEMPDSRSAAASDAAGSQHAESGNQGEARTMNESQQSPAHADSLIAEVNDWTTMTGRAIDSQQLKQREQSEQHEQKTLASDGKAVLMRSTDADQQRHSILELLHSHISSHKEYPYLARRQGREGVSTVAFLLYPCLLYTSPSPRDHG